MVRSELGVLEVEEQWKNVFLEANFSTKMSSKSALKIANVGHEITIHYIISALYILITLMNKEFSLTLDKTDAKYGIFPLKS